MKQHFLTAALAVCTLQHVRDPETEKMGWIIKCRDGVKQEYATPNFIKRERRAKYIARQWLDAHRPRDKVSVIELRAGK